MKSILPVVISIPHGGTFIPGEVRNLCRLNAREILEDGDTWSKEIYTLSGEVAACIKTSIARAVLDMNRSCNDLPPNNPDGVVKTVTVFNKQIWPEASGLPGHITEFLINKYHKAYHRAITNACKDKDAVLGLDCHTMLAAAPSGSRFPGELRPLICLSNGGDEHGKPINMPVTAPPELLFAFGDAIIKAFEHADIQIQSNIPLLVYNNPFRGGYITKHHGLNSKIPWIQIELSKALYIPEHPQFDYIMTSEIAARLKSLQNMFRNALHGFLKELKPMV
ncbi:N-formylglutamate amidohydrolase [Desulfitibacter alkalitolerans]|uniref:N-formylglutamate amidohydrolase n=1 Tax=Desulfitibacter alkalitolerans TaxID=264641 RepID=UPI00068692A6|nr:N-formylglutamate amidohydrolase [Desulfitibacter alkalitolerans]